MKFILIEYSLLRNILDSRPLWMKQLGLIKVLLNGYLIEREFPRLRFKRKLGSYVAPTKADSLFIKEQEEKYQNYYNELVSRNK